MVFERFRQLLNTDTFDFPELVFRNIWVFCICSLPHQRHESIDIHKVEWEVNFEFHEPIEPHQLEGGKSPYVITFQVEIFKLFILCKYLIDVLVLLSLVQATVFVVVRSMAAVVCA